MFLVVLSCSADPLAAFPCLVHVPYHIKFLVFTAEALCKLTLAYHSVSSPTPPYVPECHSIVQLLDEDCKIVSNN